MVYPFFHCSKQQICFAIAFLRKVPVCFYRCGTGYFENGKPVFDPGYDVVVGEIPGKGAIACRFATHFLSCSKPKASRRITLIR